MAITGLNHITLAVTDLDRSVTFYRDLLGGHLRAIWAKGAYLSLGDLWLCLTLSSAPVKAREDYTHIALSCSTDDFPGLAARIAARAERWQDNRSQGESLYFLDPDGHKLELHVGGLAQRLAHYRAENGEVTVLDEAQTTR